MLAVDGVDRRVPVTVNCVALVWLYRTKTRRLRQCTDSNAGLRPDERGLLDSNVLLVLPGTHDPGHWAIQRIES